MLAVEEEAAVGGPFEPAEADGDFDFVGEFVGVEFDLEGVERRMIGVPELGIGDGGKSLIDLGGRLRCDGLGDFRSGDDLAIRVQNTCD